MRKSIVTLMLTVGTMCLATAQKVEPYLATSQLPTGETYLPAPPDTTEQLFLNDYINYQIGKGKRDSERGRQAQADAHCGQRAMANYYSQAMGIQITDSTTPALYRLIGRVGRTASDATHTAKEHYRRPRPFMQFHEHTSVMESEKYLIDNGSYPSGHTSIGWSIALVLCEINPGAQDEILRLGYEFGQSRVIVGAHWQSDVDAGRMVGAAAVARMHADEGFVRDMAEAKAEFATMKKGKPVLKGKPRMRLGK